MISEEAPDSPAASALIGELEAELALQYAPEHRHGLGVQQLVDEAVAFFVVRDQGTAAGCAGLQFFKDFAEIKRMYVRPAFRGRGLGRSLLMHLEEFARRRGVSCLRLETGIRQHDAIALYEKAGFKPIPSFGHYQHSSISRCYEKPLA